MISVFVIIFGMISINYIKGATTRFDNYAEQLSKIGVFVGTGSGFDLDREPTRLEGLIMLIRLLGVEKEAIAMSNASIPFTDVPDWGRGYVAYAYSNGLTNGVGNNLFGTNQLMTSNSYMTFVLRALKYDDKAGDFTWEKANDFALKIGLLSESLYFDIQSKVFLRDHVAKISYDTLQTNLNKTNTSLLSTLVEKGVIDATIASSMVIVENSTGEEVFDINAALDACVYIEIIGYDNSKSSGSGFFIDGNGSLVTNYHVIKGAKTINIMTQDEKVYSVNTLTGYSIVDDLAILKVPVVGNKYFNLTSTNTTKVGDKIFTIGSPMGLKNTVAEGIISAVRTDGIQISAPISPGSSGGALLNSEGEVIGVTYAGYVDGENLGFAIPINKVISLARSKVETNIVSLFSNITSLNSTDAVKTYMENSFPNIVVNGLTVNIAEYVVNPDESGKGYNITAYVDAPNFLRFVLSVNQNYSITTEDLSDYVFEIMENTGLNIYFSITYVDTSVSYPSAYISNSLFEDTVSQLDNGEWLIYYPLVFMYTTTDSNIYRYLYWYE